MPESYSGWKKYTISAEKTMQYLPKGRWTRRKGDCTRRLAERREQSRTRTLANPPLDEIRSHHHPVILLTGTGSSLLDRTTVPRVDNQDDRCTASEGNVEEIRTAGRHKSMAEPVGCHIKVSHAHSPTKETKRIYLEGEAYFRSNQESGKTLYRAERGHAESGYLGTTFNFKMQQSLHIGRGHI